MRYRISAIEIAGFRGFNTPQRLSLDSQFIIFYAPNGHGKSSLCEAIEWALYGSTSRRTHGEQSIHKREFEGSMRNKHYPAGGDAYVTLLLSDNADAVEIKRVITDEEDAGLLFLNNQQIDDLACLGISQEIRHPLILQHSLRNFIFAKPGDRLNAISSQLGMGAFTRFQTAMQNASRSFKTKEPSVAAALNLLSELINACSPSPKLAALHKCLISHEVTEATLRSCISTCFEGVCDRKLPDEAAAIEDIELELQKVIRRAFDVSKLGIDQDISQSFSSIDKRFEDTISAVTVRRTNLLSPIPSEQVQRERDLSDLAKRGLPLIRGDSPVCPLCGQRLTDNHMDAIRHKAVIRTDQFDACALLLEQSRSLGEALRQAELLFPYKLGEDDIERLRGLLAQKDAVLDSYQKMFVSLDSAFRLLAQNGGIVIKALGELHDNASQSSVSPSDLDALLEELATVRSNLLSCKDARHGLMSLYKSLRSLVEGSVASSAEVALLRTLKTCLEKLDTVLLASADRMTESLAEDCVKRIQDFSRKKRNEILETKSAEMIHWFSLLNPGHNVKFKGMRSTASQVSLLGEVFGEEVNVSSIFSEAQLNCLGLSFYAVTAYSLENPLDFVVIDDPVQSMDQPHIENFKDSYLRRMLDSGRQVILLTHMQTLALSVDTLYRHLEPYSLEVASYAKEGPQIIETEEALNRMLRDIDFYKDGDSDRRRLAGSILRKFLERFAKELYRKKHGTLPKKYEGAMWDKLKDLIRHSGLALSEESRVFESYKFCANFPHDDITKDPPTSSEIEAHYMRLKALKEKYLDPQARGAV